MKFNERTKHFLIKYISHFILERGSMFVVGLRDRWRDIYSKRRLLLVPYLLLRSRECQRWHPLASHIDRDDQTPLIGYVSLARLSILWTLSKSKSHGLLLVSPVGPDCPDALSSPCALIITWQLVKAHGVTRNEPKIHVKCYITIMAYR